MSNSQKISTRMFVNGVLILTISNIIIKLIGLVFKIPLQHLIGNLGFGYFSSAYDLFTPMYTLSMAGLPIEKNDIIQEEN